MKLQTLEQVLIRQTQLLEQMANRDKGTTDTLEKALAGNSTYTPLHGPGGIFASAAIERDVISAHVRPFGLASRLPLIPTVFTHPLFPALTGFTDVTGTEPTKACDDAPSGYMKGCNLTARLGMIRRDSREIDLDDVMLKLHRGDHTDLMLRGQVLGLTNLAPTIAGASVGDILNVVSASEMVNVGVQMERKLNKQLWQGVTTVANEFPGLDVQIATGQKDAETGTLCPALDSDVKDFAYDRVDGTGRDIVEYMSMLEFYVRYNAMTMGLEPVTWLWVMRPELWQELTAIWPCKYNTNRCNTIVTGQGRVVIDGRENITERDNMRNGLYIDVNGNRYDVVLDTGIFEHTNVNNANVPLGNYASSIYFVPLTVMGMPVTYREYLDYRQAATDYSYTQNRLDVWWTDNGVFSWSIQQQKWCYKFHAKTEQRVVLRAPHLAGKIQRVRYSPLQHLRESDPTSPYFMDGGVSLRANVPNYQAVWL